MKKTNYERGGHFLDTITSETTALSINRTSKNYSVQITYKWQNDRRFDSRRRHRTYSEQVLHMFGHNHLKSN